MSLVTLWKDSKAQFQDKHIQQIIAFAGSGKLREGNEATSEFRAFLSAIPSKDLGRYANECLSAGFTDSGLALQDIVNEVGTRLGFVVVSGRYRGAQGQIGFDGLWSLPDGRSIVIEVKTTDAYRIDLGVIAGYRKQLISDGKIKEGLSSILIIVGREDTGDLEAQIRGSRHAWGIRLVSVEAMLRLMALKEEVEDPNIIKKIHDILFPMEFTRLDEIIEIVFWAAEDAKEEIEQEVEIEKTAKGPNDKKITPVAFHQACIDKIQNKLGYTLIKRSRASFSTSNEKVAVVCAVSRIYTRGGTEGYWFAFHPHQKEFLEKAEQGYMAFGCGSPENLFLINIKEFSKWVDAMNTTKKEDRFYWHVIIFREKGRFVISRKKGAKDIDISEYLLPVKS